MFAEWRHVILTLRAMAPQTKMFVSGRAAVFLILSYALGPGLLVNVALKDNWGRPRPGHITQFGGDKHFVRFGIFAASVRETAHSYQVRQPVRPGQ